MYKIKIMKRPKIKIFHENLQKNTVSQIYMSPWDANTPKDETNRLQQIPTYRRQIVEKFLSSIHTKNKKSPNLQSDQQIHKFNRPEKHKLQSNLLNKNRKKMSKTQANDGDINQQNQIVRIFKDQYERKRKSKLKTAIIYFDSKVTNEHSRRKQKFQKQQQQNKKVFTKKLRMKEEIANKKNIERTIRKHRSATVSNIFRNPFYLYQFGNIQSSQTRNITSASCPTNPRREYQRAFEMRKRPASEVGFHSKENHQFY